MKKLKLVAIKTKAIIWSIVSVFCYLMLITGVAVTVENPDTDKAGTIVTFILFITLAAVSTRFMIKTWSKYISLNKIINILFVERKISIYSLSFDIGKTSDKTRDLVSEAIRNNLVEAYIDEDENIITKAMEILEENLEEDYDKEVLPSKKKTVRCENCGASNEYIEDEENRCEYCHTIL